MREGFYAIFYTGAGGGQGVLSLCLKNGKLVGIDATGGHVTGTYIVDDATLVADSTFHFRAGELVTGQTLAQPWDFPCALRLPLRLLAGETVEVDIGTGPINARGEFIAEPL